MGLRVVHRDFFDSYAGTALSAIADDAQTTRYTHDALGRPIGESVTLAGLSRTFATATCYDPATGLVASRTLADGQVLRSQRSTPAKGATLEALTLQLGWAAQLQDWLADHLSPRLGKTAGRWLPGQTLARDIAVHPFDGLTGYTAGNGIATRKTYDIAGRLTALEAAGIERRQYRYNTGPRIQEIDSSSPTAQPIKTAYRYTGFGRLAQHPDPENSATPQPLIRDPLGRLSQDTRYRYTYTPAGLLASVSDLSGNPIARYRYNSLDQRIAKTVGNQTTYTLWQQGKRVAEIDAAGRITSQYLYLTEGTRTLTLAKLESAANPDNPSHEARTLYIHSDQRGAPLAMTDQTRQTVWRADLTAWGTARPIGAGAASLGPATLNLRLPGQYYDAETGLHDNWHRTYDPNTGRYLQPDPLGYPDGPDAYLYAQGDPVNRADSSGMYAEDVHYYMTYFLALTAGLSANDAWIIATADQTVDNVNPYTDAYPSVAAGGNLDAREKYHFTQTSTAFNPNNRQVVKLNGYAINTSSPCLKAQFYGEYLHAYQDTYGHRDQDNVPYGTGGHAHVGTNPDMTYNHISIFGYWGGNEARTLLMERAAFAQIQRDWGVTAKDGRGNTITFTWLEVFLKEWNKVRDNNMKRIMLNEQLADLGLPKIPQYIAEAGLGCRLKYLRNAHLINAAGKATSDPQPNTPAPSSTPRRKEQQHALIDIQPTAIPAGLATACIHPRLLCRTARRMHSY
ncbi:hypothetical protein SKTS_30310 [Sulfurimicrobium lacus]|uniref:Teneurin-like YD-shell domain-containing protein n=1 Tax=Sulfurimicrobium lacus TaxID=2715678 RepID=A0A6F8VHA5_9PROT|nr:RHS repeat-associated core domain-containing protein [Sulfurimicrobium lacus]BCB28145.1 hypothetical protein SKTS_30310 [Sulfurimicrobium lacus]